MEYALLLISFSLFGPANVEQVSQYKTMKACTIAAGNRLNVDKICLKIKVDK